MKWLKSQNVLLPHKKMTENLLITKNFKRVRTIICKLCAIDYTDTQIGIKKMQAKLTLAQFEWWRRKLFWFLTNFQNISRYLKKDYNINQGWVNRKLMLRQIVTLYSIVIDD